MELYSLTFPYQLQTIFQFFYKQDTYLLIICGLYGISSHLNVTVWISLQTLEKW